MAITSQQTTQVLRRNDVPNELKTLRPAGGYTFDELYRFAQMCHTSGLFEDVADAAQAMIKIVKGQELGLPPTTAMAGFDLIKKRLFIKPWIIAAQINACGYGMYKVLTQTDALCTIQFSKKYPGRGWEECPSVSYSFVEAKAHGLVDRSPHWKASPAHMLFQRAMGRGGAMYFPELLAGLQPPPDDTPIPPERHRQNITDLFGDDPRGSTPPAADVIDVETGEVHESHSEQKAGERTSEPASGKTQPSIQTGWRDTLTAHVVDTDKLTAVLPPETRARYLTALNDPKFPDSEGLLLAGEVLEWVFELKG